MQEFPTDGEWVVCHVRPRCEKKLAAYCATENIGVFLPTLISEKTYGNRKRTHTLPLFSGYLFARAPLELHAKIRQNQNCANLLQVVDQKSFQHRMQHLHQALQTNVSVEVVPYIVKGKKVKITQGPFLGIEGIISEIHGQDHIIVNIDLIQQSVAFKADWSMLKPAD